MAEEARATVQTGRNIPCVRHFVRTPFSVRCNVVKVWRDLPENLWTSLREPDDWLRAKRRERWSVAGVAVMAAVLLAGFANLGYATHAGHQLVGFPVMGWARLAEDMRGARAGWFFRWGQSTSLVFWAVGPALLGWAFVRLFWIPTYAPCDLRRCAILAFARYLSAVYLYVFAMVTAGAVLLTVLLPVAPQRGEWYRWCFWCFLFGESFFVPGVTWLRLVLHDKTGLVFGPFRYYLLAGYLGMFVAAPVYGMVQEL